MKRSVNNAKINKDADNIGFEYEDVQFIFTGGNILAIKEGRIVEKRAISDFARRPADTYRRLRMAIMSKKRMQIWHTHMIILMRNILRERTHH